MDVKVATPPKRARVQSREKQPATPDPVEIAMATAASGKPLPDAARNVLEKHARLIDCQAELAKAQLSELRLRHIGEGVRAALWASLAVVAFLIIALIISVAVRAARSDALIVERFRVPPSLEGRGLTGEVVATQVLDRLAEMQEQTQSVRAASTYANNWQDELKIDIPNTGASTSEIWKLLRGWLGKETRISGEVIETGRGLALTARVGSASGQRFVNDKADLDALVTQAAELIYRRTQPYRFAIYAGQQGRTDERNTVLLELTKDPSPVERKWAYSGLSFSLNGLGRFRESVAMARRALAIDPAMGPALGNGGTALRSRGHDQEAFDWAMRLRDAHDRGYSREYDPLIAATSKCENYSDIAWFLRDPTLYDRSAACTDAAAKGTSADANWARTVAAFLRHDPEPLASFRQQPTEDFFPVW